MANQFFDRRLGYLVQTPGLDTPLETLEFKAGDGEEIVLQFGRSPDSATPISVVSSPTWTAENLPAGSTIAIGIKASGDYYDGDLLAGSSSFVQDTDEMTYTFDLDLNTTAINTALSRADADDTNDVAAIENALYEVTYTPGAGGTDKSSVRDITTTIKHDVLSGAEGTPTNAGDPDDYSLVTNTIQFFPAISSQTGGTAADLDSITTVSRSAGEGVAFFDDDSSGDLRVYELVAGTDAESSPDVIRPDDYASSTNEKVWKLRLDISGGGGGISNVVDDTTPQLGGPLDTNSKPIKESKGSDVASANALSLGTDGNFFDITGTTTIASIDTIAVGTEVTLQFDDALTLNHSTDLYLPTQNNITTAAGDVAKFREYDTGDWVCVSYLKADGTPVASSGGISNIVEDTSPQLGGSLDTNDFQINESKGSDIASATTLNLTGDGNFFDITGTTTISAIATRGVGTRVTLQFDGVLTLNFSATNLILPTSANITTAAGDIAVFREHATGKWTCESYTKRDGTALLQTTSSSLGSSSELTISSAAITVTGLYHSVDTESDAASDLLSIINGGTAGDVLYLEAENTNRTVIIGEAGNITTLTGDYVYLNDTNIIEKFIYNGSRWVQQGTPRSTILQFDSITTDVTGEDSLGTTYSDLTGSSVTITPRVHTDSSILYRYTFLVSTETVSETVLAHFKILQAGVDVDEAYYTINLNGTTNGGTMVTLEAVLDSPPSGTTTIKVQGRKYSTAYDTKCHETLHADGSTGNNLCRPTMTFYEFKN